MVEVTIGGDQSVDRNGGTEGKRSTHLNTDQSSSFEHPSHGGFVEGGGGGVGQVKEITPIVLYFHTVLLYVFQSCIKLRLYCQLNMFNVENERFCQDVK